MPVDIRPAIPWDGDQHSQRRREWCPPGLDDVPYPRNLVDGAVVHDDDGLGSGERLHLEDQICDEGGEKIPVERALDDHAFDNAVVEGNRWQN